MWPTENSGVNTIPELFREWLASEAQEYLQGEYDPQYEAPCLLDLVHLWITQDPEIIRISSWGVFMAGVLAIVGAWLDGDQITIPLVAGSPKESPALLVHPVTKTPVRITRLFPETPKGDFWNAQHPVLDPTVFEMRRASALANLTLQPKRL